METEKVKLIDGTESEIHIYPLSWVRRNQIYQKATKSELVGNAIKTYIDMGILMTESLKAIVKEHEVIDKITPEEGDRLFNKYVVPFLGLGQSNQEENTPSSDNPENQRPGNKDNV